MGKLLTGWWSGLNVLNVRQERVLCMSRWQVGSLDGVLRLGMQMEVTGVRRPPARWLGRDWCP